MATRTRRHKFALTLAALTLAVAGTVGAAGVTAAPAEAAGRCVDYNYSQGGYSSCVGYIQQLLNYQGAVPQLAADNAFGAKTKTAVVSFQGRHRLVQDGIVGANTWRFLCMPGKGPGPVPGFPYAAARAAGCSI